jgi:hypothetical protein
MGFCPFGLDGVTTPGLAGVVVPGLAGVEPKRGFKPEVPGVVPDVLEPAPAVPWPFAASARKPATETIANIVIFIISSFCEMFLRLGAQRF